jgi:hypothetical protein
VRDRAGYVSAAWVLIHEFESGVRELPKVGVFSHDAGMTTQASKTIYLPTALWSRSQP